MLDMNRQLTNSKFGHCQTNLQLRENKNIIFISDHTFAPQSHDFTLPKNMAAKKLNQAQPNECKILIKKYIR